MRGLATLALMSLLLIHGEAQPLSQPTVEQSEAGSYTKSFDCDGSSQLLKDDSGHTLTCNGNKVRVRTTNDTLVDTVSNLRHVFSTMCHVRMARLSI